MRSPGCSVRTASVQPCLARAVRRRAHLGAEQRIVAPALRLVDVELGRHDVEVAGQDDGALESHQLARRAPVSRSNQRSL